MKKVLLYGGIGLVALLGVGVGGAFLMPSSVRVERSVVVPRPACTVGALLDGYTTFNDWSPWAQLDPNTRYTFEGPADGVGAAMSWVSEHPDVGSGRQEITAVAPCEGVDMSLAFGGQPPAAAAFVLTPEGAGTRMRWWIDMDLGLNPIARYMGPMLDGMVGPDLERGLSNFTTFAQKYPETDFAGLVVERVDAPPMQLAEFHTTSGKDPVAVGAALGAAYGSILASLPGQGLQQAGPVRASYRADGPGYAIVAAIPVKKGEAVAAPSALPAGLRMRLDKGGPSLKIVHLGAYGSLSETWAKVEAWAAAADLRPREGAPTVEEYVSDPTKTPEAELLTNLYFPY